LLVRTLIAAVVLIFSGAAAYAQNQPVHQTGVTTRGHLTMWSNPGQLGDAGGALNGHLLNLGITPDPLSTLPPFGLNDAPISNPGGYHQLTIEANDGFGDGGQLAYGAISGAPNLPLTIQSGSALALNSNIQQIAFQNLPPTVAGDVPVCVIPATGQLVAAPSTNQTILLTDDSGAHLLTDDTGTFILTATQLAGQCIQQ
jgi:hypothetical protein